jgi:hypothetical protein
MIGLDLEYRLRRELTATSGVMNLMVQLLALKV